MTGNAPPARGDAAGAPVPTATCRPSQRAAKGFRPDIQGLRAVAVVTVALDHASIGPFHGGFVGVDVFFVVSGFLITQLLLAERQRSGSISLSGFYARRARRILPAATVVLIATVLGGLLLLNFVRAKALVDDAVWVTFFAGNVHFGQLGTDYFAADTPPSALQHFWSLAVEEQFYLVWPLLLALLLGTFWPARSGARRRRLHMSRIDLRVLVGLGAVVAVSLLLSVRMTASDPTGAYFSTVARGWELGLGASVAVLAPTLIRVPGAVGAVMQGAGLGLIAYAVLAFSATTPYPGTAALVPVTGAALVVAGGCSRRSAGVRWALENRPMQTLGDWSYSLYLWHWPVLVIAAEYAGHRLSWQQNAGLLIAAVALSGLTYALVENPFRRARWLARRPRRSLVLYPLAVVVTLAVCVVSADQIRQEVEVRSNVAAVSTHNFGGDTAQTTFSTDPQRALLEASALAARNHLPIPGALNPGILALSDDKASVGKCDYDVPGTRTVCERGAVGSDHAIVLFGDSHARHWIPAVEAIAEKHGLAAYYFVKPACSAAQITPDAGAAFVDDCLSWRAWAIDEIHRLRPSVLVVGGEAPDRLVDDSGDLVSDDAATVDMYEAGLVDSLGRIGPAAGRTFVIADPPGLAELPADCLAARGHDLGDCASPPSHRDGLEISAARQAANQAGASVIATKPWFCYRDLCPAVVGSTITYWDNDHITKEYALELAPALDAKLGL